MDITLVKNKNVVFPNRTKFYSGSKEKTEVMSFSEAGGLPLCNFHQ